MLTPKSVDSPMTLLLYAFLNAKLPDPIFFADTEALRPELTHKIFFPWIGKHTFFFYGYFTKLLTSGLCV